MSLPRLALANGPQSDSPSLIRILEKATASTSGKGARRQVYLLSCYFDKPALVAALSAIGRGLADTGGSIAGVTIAVDVAEWIRCRLSVGDLVADIASAASLPAKLVRLVPVSVSGQLLHAKAYAALRSPLEPGRKNGFLIVSSGNATGPGLGLTKAANLELAALITDLGELADFHAIMKDLIQHEVSPELAVRQDEFLSALHLFGRGAFFHRWSGSLGSEIRFTLTPTAKGKRARKGAFKGYDPDSDTMSRDPLNLESVFDQLPKPFPADFWRQYSVDTLLGVWVPNGVADLVLAKTAEGIEKYRAAIEDRTAPDNVARVCKQLRRQVSAWSKARLIKEEPQAAVAAWSARALRFAEQDDLIRQRIQPYELVPEMLESATRTTIMAAVKILKVQLAARRQIPRLKVAISEFLDHQISAEDLEAALASIAVKARERLDSHAGQGA